MAVSVVVVAFCLTLTVVQLDRIVVRNQLLAILPTLGSIPLRFIRKVR